MSAVNASDERRLREAIEAERLRIADQVESLEQSFAGIVAGTELTSNDDEHDPEGTTIAYERAQVAALLRQGLDDLHSLEQALVRVENGTALTCESCGGPIAFERVLALPMTRLCVTCAS